MKSRHQWYILTSVAFGTFMATLDSSIVNIVLPTLSKALTADLHQVKWIVIVYLFTVTALLLPFGKLSDHIGRKRVFQTGLMLFVLGSALCSLAPDLNTLILFRVIQAIGAAMLFANAPAIITSTFSRKQRGTALGILTMAVSIGLVSGPSLGGLLISNIGWRSIFWINIPIGALGISFVQRYLPRDKPSIIPDSFDWAGALLQMVFLLLFMLLFNAPDVQILKQASQLLHGTQFLLTLCVILIGSLFLHVERQCKQPLFDTLLFRNRTFWTANAASFLFFMSFSSVHLLVPFFLEDIQQLSPQKAGLLMTSIPLTIFVAAPISGRISDRMGSRGLSLLGAAIGSLTLLKMGGVFGTGFTNQTASWEIFTSLAGIGLATGIFQSPNNSSIMGVVAETKINTASAMLATIRNLGSVTGTGLSSSLFTWNLHQEGGFLTSFHTVLCICGCIALAAMGISWVKPKGPHSFEEKN